MDALSFRFNCVEADLWLIDGELYVSHDHPEPAPIIAFENLHLKPFTACIQANDGKIYPGSDRPMSSPPKENSRFTCLDGQIKDLRQGIPTSIALAVSDNYADFFTWEGDGELPADKDA